MKKIFFIFMYIILISCSSSDKKNSEKNKYEKKYKEVLDLGQGKGSNKRTSRVDDDDLKKLKGLVKKGNDNEVLKEVNDILSKKQLSKNIKGIVLNALSMHHYKKGRYGLAKIILLRALKEAGEVGTFYNNLGMIALKEGEDELALKNFKRAYDLDPGNYIININLGSIYVNYELYTKAFDHLKIAHEEKKKDPFIANNYAISLRDSGKYEESQRIYKKLMESENLDHKIILNYAILLIDVLGKYSEGMGLVQRLKFLGPSRDILAVAKVLEKKADRKLQEETQGKVLEKAQGQPK